MAQICTKSFVGWGFASDRTGGAYSAPPDPLAGLREPTFKGREGRGTGGKRGEREGEREGKGKGGEGPRSGPPSKLSGSAYEGSGEEGREGRVCLVLKSPLATPLRHIPRFA